MVEGRKEALAIIGSLKERDEAKVKAGTHKWVAIPNGKKLMRVK